MVSSHPINKWAFSFIKFEASGNDFVLIEDKDESFPTENFSYIQTLCNRKRGIGADGLLLLQPSLKADALMRIFNADGYEAALCGNGLRIVGFHLLVERERTSLHIDSKSGIYRIVKKGKDIWVYFPLPRLIKEHECKVFSRTCKAYLVDAGTRHLLIEDSHFRDHKDLFFLKELRQEFDANVSLFKVEGKAAYIRTYEKGVEDETDSCGTATVSLASLYSNQLNEIHFPKDILHVCYEDQEIGLSGSIERVFVGQYQKD